MTFPTKTNYTKPLTMKTQDDFKIIYEDNHLIAVNKKGGVLVQGDKSGDEALCDMVRDYIRHKYDKQGNVFTGVIHRLDRPVSGLVILAKTSKALERMNELFREKTIKKTYLAVVNQKPDPFEDTLIHWLQKDTTKNITKVSIKEKKDSQLAELSYSLLSSINNEHLLEVNPVTGRPHQIRAQLAYVNCPIKGDLKYGSHQKAFENTIALHAYSLEFIHPIKKEPITIKTTLPDNQLWQKFSHIVSK
jgi:23S rRNA pseudouridine1911/1915/1917 synthase